MPQGPRARRCSGTFSLGSAKGCLPRVRDLGFTAQRTHISTWWRAAQTALGCGGQPIAGRLASARTTLLREGARARGPQFVGDLGPALGVRGGGQGDEVGELGDR